MYDGLKHSCIEGNHIVNVFSFSKAYGMMGWRVGYVSSPFEVLVLISTLCCSIPSIFVLCCLVVTLSVANFIKVVLIDQHCLVFPNS